MARIVPKTQGKHGVLANIIGRRYRAYGSERRRSLGPPLPFAKPEGLPHIVSAFAPIVGGERVAPKAIWGGRINLDRERTISPAMAGAWSHDIAPRYAAAERA